MGAEHPTPPSQGSTHQIPPQGTHRGVHFPLLEHSGERGSGPAPAPSHLRAPSPVARAQGDSGTVVPLSQQKFADGFIIFFNMKKINKLLYYLILLLFNYFSLPNESCRDGTSSTGTGVRCYSQSGMWAGSPHGPSPAPLLRHLLPRLPF